MRASLRMVIVMVVVSIGVALPVSAGYKTGSTIYINLTSRYANGSLATVRGTADTSQYIGCAATAWAGSNPYAYCVAADATWTNTIYADTQDPKLVASIQSIGTDSHLEFGWDANTALTYVYVSHNSYYAPKTP